jgi:polysaccharide biosynthesis transport protein
MAGASSEQSPETSPHVLTHYWYLLKRNIWFIVVSTPVIAVSAMIIVLFLVKEKDPDLTVRSLIGIENRQDLSAVQGNIKENQGREDLMLGRTFLSEVVRILSLRLVTGKKRTAVFFSSATIDSTTPAGWYRVNVNRTRKTFSLVYFDTSALRIPAIGYLPSVKGEALVVDRPLTDSTVAVQGMHLSFSRGFTANPQSFEFAVTGIRFAVENVLRSLTIKRADPEHGINYIAVQVTGNDYERIAATANEVARLFVEKNLSFSKRRTRSILEAFEKQLAIANGDQGATINALSSFQSGNPGLGFSAQAEQSVADLTRLAGTIQAASGSLSDGESMMAAFNAARGDDRTRGALAMLETMTQNNYAAARPLRDALTNLVAEQRSYAVLYDERHPLRLENTRKIEAAQGEASSLFASYLATLRSTVASSTNERNTLSQELRRMPVQEIQLNRLQRKQQVTSQVYDAVLARYNQARVADAVEIADFYIMDAAVPPLPPPQDRSRSFIVALIISLALPLLILVVRDRIQGVVYTKSGLNGLFNQPVLEAIPRFRNPGAVGVFKNASPRIDRGCDPAFVPELFDSLLLKLRLRWGDSLDPKVVAVTGLETGGGKSTIAVNTAIRLAEQGNRVLLVDTDMHRGKLHEEFGLQLFPGLAELIGADTTGVPPRKTDVEGLWVLSAGKETGNSFGLLASRRFAAEIDKWRKEFRIIVLDAAPIGVIPDAAAFAASVDSYIVTVNAGSTSIGALRDRLAEYLKIKEKVVGFVLNRADKREALLYHRSYSRYHRKWPA